MAEATESSVRMPDMDRLVVSSSPHYHAPETVSVIMVKVMLALVPALVASVCVFGWRALAVTLVCMAACVACEHFICMGMKRESTIWDGSAALTGMLLGMNLPVTAPLWMCLAGSIIAIGLGKWCYGGLGGNPFNPALVGRVALFLACPKEMATWLVPGGCSAGKWLCEAATGATSMTGATPLALLKQGQCVTDLGAMFLGSIGGSLGETSALAILIGGLFLIQQKIIRWQVPVCYVATVALFTGIAFACGNHEGCACQFVLTHVLAGGLMLGAFFMATDMVTTPLSRKGAVVFAVGCGLLTSVIRLWGAYPEGVSFSILIMNMLTPVIDKLTAGRPFGVPRSHAEVVK